MGTSSDSGNCFTKHIQHLQSTGRANVKLTSTSWEVYNNVWSKALACRVLKLLSEDPGNYKDAPREGIRRVLEQLTGKEHRRDEAVATEHIASIRMGTTVATNALLERKGERCALVTSRGFRDLLHIGNQSRPYIFDLEIQIPDTLFEAVVEIDEQVTAASNWFLHKRALVSKS